MSYTEKLINKDLRYFEVYHEVINTMLMQKYRNEKRWVPHEWYFIRLLLKEISLNENVAKLFMLFSKQYYPNYSYIKSSYQYNELSLLIAHINFYSNKFKNHYKYSIKMNEKTETNALKFGEIVTNFLISYMGYSLIKCLDQNIIITSRRDAFNRFEELLSQGYTLELLAKNYFDGEKFYKVFPFPTKENDYNYEEILEVSSNKFERILIF